MSQHPIVLSEVLDLPSLGISADAIKFGSTTMESNNFIVSCEMVDGKQTVCMIDMKDGNKISRKPISAEAAIMNPVSKVLALRAGTQLQIFNLDLRAKMKSHNMPEPLIHWCWVSPNLIALITQSGVYHWSLEGDSPPQKLEKFDVFPEGTQVISYKVSNDGKWCLLIGIRQNEGTIEGKIHLYSTDKQRFQALQGHAGTFAVIQVPGRADSAQVLIFQEKKSPTDTMKIHVMELGRDKDAPGGTFRVAPQPIVMAPEAEKDFPVTMRTSTQPNTDIVFMITRMGYLFLFDIHTGKTIYRSPQRMTKETIFISTSDEESCGILGITARTGKVLRVTINKETIVPYIIQNLQDSNLAIDLAARLQVPGAKDLYVNEFKRVLASGDSAGAANLVKGWLTANKIQASEELGDQVAPIDINVALFKCNFTCYSKFKWFPWL